MRRRIYTGEGHYHFVTFSCYKNIRLLEDSRPKQIVIDVLCRLVEKKEVVLIGFTIMSNHVHAILGYQKDDLHSKIMQEWKRWSSRLIREHLENMNSPILSKLEVFRNGKKSIRIWNRKYYDMNLFSEKKLLEKLDYMHQNPVRAGLAHHSVDYKWSSCRHYELGESSGIKIGGVF